MKFNREILLVIITILIIIIIYFATKFYMENYDGESNSGLNCLQVKEKFEYINKAYVKYKRLGINSIDRPKVIKVYKLAIQENTKNNCKVNTHPYTQMAEKIKSRISEE